MNELTAVAYIAGVIDMNGRITIEATGRVCVSVQSAQRAVIDFVGGTFGGGSRYCQSTGERSLYTIAFTNENVAELLMAVKPFLVAKRMQVTCALEFVAKFWKSRRPYQRRTWDERQLCENYAEQMAQLNGARRRPKVVAKSQADKVDALIEQIREGR